MKKQRKSLKKHNVKMQKERKPLKKHKVKIYAFEERNFLNVS
jgi:hypothetical protein